MDFNLFIFFHNLWVHLHIKYFVFSIEGPNMLKQSRRKKLVLESGSHSYKEAH